MNSTLTLTANVASAPLITSAVKPAAKPLTVSQMKRTLICKWDMIAVIGLMTSCAAYGIFVIGRVA